MKFTEQFFKFPIILYDAFALDRAARKEEEDDEILSALPVAYAIGAARVPLNEIQGWYEHWVRGRTIDDILRDGFDCTRVLTKTLGEYNCSWNIKKFEQKMDEFEERMCSQMAEEDSRATTLTLSSLSFSPHDNPLSDKPGLYSISR